VGPEATDTCVFITVSTEGIRMPKTVVVVDDSKFIIDILANFFQETMHFSVIGRGANGMDAMELYRKLKPDLLTLDIAMPIKDGYEVIEKLVAEFPDARILVVSAVRGEALIDCIQAGAADFINKPLTFNNPTFVERFVDIVNQIVP
jgi:two-component system chemotaxis response regulator CheY